MTYTIEANTLRWWTTLRAVSVVNIALFVFVAISVDLAAPYRTLHVCLAGVYTAVCAFRSFYPRVDLERVVLVDHWLSGIVLGRTSATIAEMCFTAQLALVLFEWGAGHPWLTAAGWGILVVIAIAQCTCWMGVLTGNHLWHAAEETLWAGMIIVMVLSTWPLMTALEPTWLVFTAMGWLMAAGGIWVMLGVDVPMYIRRWRSERSSGVTFMSPMVGFRDALHRREPTGAWSVWRHEVTWMTPYFSAGVWFSLLLARFSVQAMTG